MVGALTARGGAVNAIGRDACRHSLDQLGESLAMRETVSLIGDVDDATWEGIRAIVTTIGASTVGALTTAAVAEKETVAIPAPRLGHHHQLRQSLGVAARAAGRR